MLRNSYRDSVRMQKNPLEPSPGGWPGLLILRALSTQWVPRSFAFFAKGGTRECRRKFADPCRVVTNQVAHPASLLTLAKNARMGHPRWEWRTQTSLRVGPPPAAS